MVTIVLAHPWHGSFNKAILDTITANLSEQNREFQVIDLCKDGFNPVYSEKELSYYSSGKYDDPLVGKYQEMILKTKEIVFIYPIWWSDMPAILKGFFDKVFLKDFAFNYVNGWTPLLNINKTTVITTSEQETSSLETAGGNRTGHFVKDILPSVGLKNGTWLNCERVTHGSQENREKFLDSLKSI